MMKIQLLGLSQGTLDMMSTKSLKYPSRFPQATKNYPETRPRKWNVPEPTEAKFGHWLRQLGKWMKMELYMRKLYYTQTIHVWYIYLQNWVIYRGHVGKYSIHGASGYINI